MNGKFSTLLAGILLASAFSANAADVVKVTKLINGKQYVVAEKDWGGANNKKYVLQQNADGSGVIGVVGDVAKYSDAPKWTAEKLGASDQAIKIADGKYLSSSDQTSLILDAADETNSKLEYNSASLAIKVNTTNPIKFGTPSGAGATSVEVTTGASAESAIYALAYETTDEGMETLKTTIAENNLVFIKIGSKYAAVKSLASTNTEVELIDLDDTKPGYYEAVQRATWKVLSGNKKFESANSGATNNDLGVTSGKLALVADGVEFTFDGNAYCAQQGASLYSSADKVINASGEEVDFAVASVSNYPEALIFTATDVVTATNTNAITYDEFENGGWYNVSLNDTYYLRDKGSAGALDAEASESLDDNALWQVTVKETAGQQVVTLKNKKTGNYYAIGNTSSFSASTNPAYTLGMKLMVGANYIKISSTTISADGTSANAACIGLHQPNNKTLTADVLNTMEGNGFTMSVSTAKKDGTTEIEGVGAFNGKLTAVNANATSKRFQLQTEATEVTYVALNVKDTWGTGVELNGTNSNARGYKFTTVKKDDVKENHYTWFQAEYPGTNEEATNNELILSVYTAATDGELIGRLYVTKVADTYYLTTSKDVDPASKEAWPYVTLGNKSLVDLTEVFVAAPTYYSIVKVDEDGVAKGVLGVTNGGTTAGWLNLGDVQTDQPEGQWAPAEGTTAMKLVLANRENPAVKKEFAALYKTDKTTELRAASTIYKSGDDYMVLTATALADAKTSDGYEIWEQNDLRDEAFTLGLSTLFGNNAYLAENHEGKHQLGLVDNVKEAATWKFTALTGKGKADGSVITDSVYVKNTITYWNANKKGGAGWDTKVDYLKIVPYTIANAENGEPLWYSTAVDTASYICNPSGEADRFVVKKSADGKYNFIRVVKSADDKSWVLDQKMYAGFSAQYGNVQLTNIYQKRENDAFVIEKAAAPEYLKLNLGDTIRVFREGAESSLLFEKGEFLGLENIYEYTKMAPAMYVDTAFVNRTGKDNYINNCYQYLLAVEPDRHQTSEECTIPGHPSHSTDITYGRYLVSLKDSADVEAKRNLHTNKYLNSEKKAKFGFVKASHANDTLVIANSVYTGTLNQKKDSIDMGTKDFNVAKFAFKVADQDTKAFRIQTLDGYLKWMNGFIIATADEKDGDIFNLKATDENPTANEAIAAEGVQVIAGKGTVTVQGAAGKVVTVANILGQTIANQVAASDNVTIAAPAGIVVVAVEGEATKVVVK